MTTSARLCHRPLCMSLTYSTFEFVSVCHWLSCDDSSNRCISTWLCGHIWCILRWIIWPSWTHINVRFVIDNRRWLKHSPGRYFRLCDCQVPWYSRPTQRRSTCDRSNTSCRSLSQCPHHNTSCRSLSQCPHHKPWTVRLVSPSFFTDAV